MEFVKEFHDNTIQEGDRGKDCVGKKFLINLSNILKSVFQIFAKFLWQHVFVILP